MAFLEMAQLVREVAELQGKCQTTSAISNLLRRSAVITCAVLAPISGQAAVVYQFSFAANGDVGRLEIRQTVDHFIQVAAFIVTPLTDPGISFTSGTPVDAATSAIGFEQLATETLYGIALVDALCQWLDPVHSRVPVR